MTTLTVNVTREHISQGRPGQCSRCPIALALLAAIPAAGAASVYFCDTLAAEKAEGTVWTDDCQVLRVTLPPEADEFITVFDDLGPVSPFSFEAEVSEL